MVSYKICILVKTVYVRYRMEVIRKIETVVFAFLQSRTRNKLISLFSVDLSRNFCFPVNDLFSGKFF